LEHIKKIFKEEQLPQALCNLPHVESSFNYKAYSKAGAAGIWQFIRSTGRYYMKVNYLVDERLDPITASKAAAKHLKNDFRILQRWPLALTAYNHGARGMRRAIHQTGSSDIGVIVAKYKKRTFGFASKNFYAEFIAATYVVNMQEKLFGNVISDSPIQFKKVQLNRYFFFEALAKYLNIPYDSLKAHNPALRPPILSNRQPVPTYYHLKIPQHYFTNTIDSLLKNIPDQYAVKQKPVPEYYKVIRGDNLTLIARRFGSTHQALLAANNIRNPQKIFPGQILYIPGNKSSKRQLAELIPTVQKKPMDKIPLTPASPEPLVKSAQLPAASQESQPADQQSPGTNRSLSTRTEPVERVSKGQLAGTQSVSKPVEGPATNPFSPVIKNFFQLYLQTMTGLQFNFVKDQPPSVFPLIDFNANIYHLDMRYSHTDTLIVQIDIDETIGHFAEWINQKASTIRHMNRIDNQIKVGQKIKLPCDRKIAEIFSKKRLEFHLSIEEDFYQNFIVTGVQNYVNKKKRPIWGICNQNDIPLWLFRKYNSDAGPNSEVFILPVIKEKAS